MKTYRNILFDIDDTIFDFSDAETNALKHLFHYLGFPLTEQLHQDYTAYNRRLWNQIDEGKLTRDQMQQMRFSKFFKKKFNYEVRDSDRLVNIYQEGMATSHVFRPHAKQALDKLRHQGFHLGIISNGIYHVQMKRLTDSGILTDFDQIFISEKMGVMKPTLAYFDKVFEESGWQAADSLVVGDDLHSDIAGAKAAGLDSVWYNFRKQPNMANIHPTYVIDDLAFLPELLA